MGEEFPQTAVCLPPTPSENSTVNLSPIKQFDGNLSIDQSECPCCDEMMQSTGCSSDMSVNYNPVYDDPPSQIPVHISQGCNQNGAEKNDPPVWFEKYLPRKVDKGESKLNRVTIRRDNRLENSISLPTVAVSNVRSLLPKIENFKTDLKEREISLSLLSEVWEKQNCKKQQAEFEKMLRMDGLKYISTPRMSKRGGGAAIVVDLQKFSLEKIEIANPNKLEVVWGILRPFTSGGNIKEIICAAFYSPPRSRKNSLLLDHLVSTTHYLLSKWPDAGLILGGDKNNLNISVLLSGIPRLRQIVTQNTHKNKILDVILTNLHSMYTVPVIVPPVPADDPSHGVPSDHATPVAYPRSGCNIAQSREYITRISRPLPESGIREFGQWITSEDWSCILESESPSQQVSAFEKLLQFKLNTILPQKSMKFCKNFDKPFYTSDLKKLDRALKREYRKHQKSDKYVRLKSDYDRKYYQAANAYMEKNVRSLMQDNPAKAHINLKKLAAQPGDCTDEGTFTLVSHQDQNLSSEEAMKKIIQHFSSISQEFDPLSTDLLSDDVRAKLAQISETEIPELAEHEVWQKNKNSKKSKSVLPGDVPKRILTEFSPEFSSPMCKIFNKISKSGHWPKSWRIEYGTALQKKQNPETEDDLRIISLTKFFSKVYERFVVSWLLHYVGDKLDWGQYGAMKGSSISHYLVDLVNYILYNQDLKDPHAVLAVLVDFKKAFNRINHNIVINILSEMNVPGWLIRIVMGFLSEREIILRYKGLSSESESLPGGGPQGTLLGLFLFLILINYAGLAKLKRNIGAHVTQQVNKRTPVENIHLKYIDDMSLAEAINLKNKLVANPDPSPTRPLSYHERTEHILPDDEFRMQEILNNLIEYCSKNQMKINGDKTKVMLFNNGRKFDFMPKISLDGQNNLEVVEKIKLLGVHIRSDLRWFDNTNHICKKGYKRLWVLRRLKRLGASESDLVYVYFKQIRCVLELAVPVWTPGLTMQEEKMIERVQKAALYIILGDKYQSYSQALEKLNCEPLQVRRQSLCLRFARKALRHEKYSKWFKTNSSKAERPNTRASKVKQTDLVHVPYRTGTGTPPALPDKTIEP